jgi:hypothetical protein
VTGSQLNAGCREEISGMFANKLKDTGRQRYVNWSAEFSFFLMMLSMISVPPRHFYILFYS